AVAEEPATAGVEVGDVACLGSFLALVPNDVPRGLDRHLHPPRLSPGATVTATFSAPPHALALREGVRGVGHRGVTEPVVAPRRAPAVADDEPVGRVAHDRYGVPAPTGPGVRVEVALGGRSVVPGRIDVEAGDDGTVGGQPTP